MNHWMEWASGGGRQMEGWTEEGGGKYRSVEGIREIDELTYIYYLGNRKEEKSREEVQVMRQVSLRN